MTYPIITTSTPSKGGIEVLVPGRLRDDGALCLNDLGKGQPGFTDTLVLFTYYPNGLHEIYLIKPEQIDDYDKRYMQCYNSMSEGISNSVDAELESVHGIGRDGPSLR